MPDTDTESPTTSDKLQDLAESYLSGGGMSGATINQENQQTQSLIFNPNIQIAGGGDYLPSVDSGISPTQISDQSGRTAQPGQFSIPSEANPEQFTPGITSMFSPMVIILLAGGAVVAYLLLR